MRNKISYLKLFVIKNSSAAWPQFSRFCSGYCNYSLWSQNNVWKNCAVLSLLIILTLKFCLLSLLNSKIKCVRWTKSVFPCRLMLCCVLSFFSWLSDFVQFSLIYDASFQILQREWEILELAGSVSLTVLGYHFFHDCFSAVYDLHVWFC